VVVVLGTLDTQTYHVPDWRCRLPVVAVVNVPNDRVPFRNKLDESANQNDARKEKEESVGSSLPRNTHNWQKKLSITLNVV
jgi:hypothetical protein